MQKPSNSIKLTLISDMEKLRKHGNAAFSCIKVSAKQSAS